MDHADLFHTFSKQEIFERFNVSPQGLTEEEVKKRQDLFGKNTLQEEKTKFLTIFFRQFKSIPIYILFVASLVSISIGEWVDFGIIIGVILTNGLIGFWQEIKAESSIAALKKLTETKNLVIRQGKRILVLSSELVPGDYVVLQEGEAITTDIRLVDSRGLMIDESAMTGESVPVIKNHDASVAKEALPYELSNMLLAGTVVVRGVGHGVVVRTNGKTYLASIAEKAKEKSPITPLNRALDVFMRRFVSILIVIFILLAFIGMMQGRHLIDLSYILLAGLVSAVPEGLVVVITLVMVLGAMALTKRQTLIRYLPSVETLGSVTILASDKTGTITEGKLIVKEVHTKEIDKLKKVAALCNEAHQGHGDPLDVALSAWVKEYDQIRALHPRRWHHPFDSHLMLMATANQMEEGEELFVKGAFEALQEKADNADEFIPALTSFLDHGLRVIAFGHGKWEHNPDASSWKIKIIGIVGFLDPAKEGVEEAVFSARKAGIHILMVTGDHPKTAKAIAKEVQIWKEGDQILTGKEIETMSDEALLSLLKKTTILARVLPEHKYRVVKLLQKSKEIVAMTGDGVNDVPALKAADIGIAMGSGTEAAKSVSKMIITDNNLKIIVGAIRNARIIADNIRKVIYYLVSTTLQEVVLLVLAIVNNFPLPLIAIQILWINLIGSGVQDKAFPFAKEEGSVMDRKPRKPESQFFDLAQLFRILIFGIATGVVCFFLYTYLLDLYPPSIVSTIIFTSVIFGQWANGIQAQKETEPFFKNVVRSFTINPFVYAGISLGLVLQYMVVYITPHLFDLHPIDLVYWKYPLGVFLISFGIVEIRKWISYFFFRRKKS